MSDIRAKLIHNEQTKLLSNLLTMMARSSFVVGVAAPIGVMFLYNPVNMRFAPAVIGMILWTIAAGILHLAGRYVLRGLKP